MQSIHEKKLEIIQFFEFELATIKKEFSVQGSENDLLGRVFAHKEKFEKTIQIVEMKNEWENLRQSFFLLTEKIENNPQHTSKYAIPQEKLLSQFENHFFVEEKCYLYLANITGFINEILQEIQTND